MEIQFSDEQLQMAVVSTNNIGKEYTYDHIRTVTWSGELLVDHIKALRGLYPSYPETVDVEAMVPQCEEVTIQMYGSDGQTEAFSIYCFDGVPGWFEETEGQWRTFVLHVMPELRYMTLDDVCELAKLEEPITWEHLAGFTATSWGSGVVRADFYVEDGYILRFYMEGTELEGDGELICIPIEISMGIHDPDLEEFLEKTQTFAEKWVRNQEAKYQRYLPNKDSELWTEASVQKQWMYGTFINLSIQCFRDGQLVLDWSVGDSRLAEGVGPLIEAAELTPQTLEKAVEPDGKICVDVLFDDVWVSIDAYDISAQWLYDQLIAVRERVDAVVDADEMKLDKALVEFDLVMQEPDLDGLCLKIYYMDSTVFTYAPLSAEDLKSGSIAQTISVDTQTLSEYTELLRRLNASAVKQAEELIYVNARMCYVFETGDGETVLEIVFNHPSGGIFVNGMAVEYDPVFLEVSAPFATEELKELWMPEDS